MFTSLQYSKRWMATSYHVRYWANFCLSDGCFYFHIPRGWFRQNQNKTFWFLNMQSIVNISSLVKVNSTLGNTNTKDRNTSSVPCQRKSLCGHYICGINGRTVSWTWGFRILPIKIMTLGNQSITTLTKLLTVLRHWCHNLPAFPARWANKTQTTDLKIVKPYWNRKI